MMFHIGDIGFFRDYQFNDTGEVRPHYGLVLLPSTLSGFSRSVYCAVITSKEHTFFTFVIEPSSYSFLKSKSFIRLSDHDFVEVDESDARKQNCCGPLNATDLKDAFLILKKALFVPSLACSKISPYLKGTIIREWKKSISNSTR